MTTRVSYELKTLKESVQSNFAKVRSALYMREKLLLRQLEVIAQQSNGRCYPNINSTMVDNEQQIEAPLGIKFLIDEQEEAALYENIRSFGRFQLGNMNLTLQNVFLRHEDYIRPNKDHEVMNKCLQLNENEEKIAGQQIYQGSHVTTKESCLAEEEDLSSLTQNKLIMENTCRQISESIINLTLTEAKKLLNQSQNKIVENLVPPLDLENDEINSSQVDVISSLLQDQDLAQTTQETQTNTNSEQRYKHKIIINNCNGTINLRNIASLIINCTGEDAVNTELPLQHTDNNTATTTSGMSTSTTNTNNHCHCKISKNQTNRKNKHQEPTKYEHHSINSGSLCSNKNKNNHMKSQIMDNNEENMAATCEFYNNLLLQIKNSLVTKKQQHIDLNTINENVVLNDDDDDDADDENDNEYSYFIKQKSKNSNEEEDYINENDCIEEDLSKLTSVSDVNDNEATTITTTNSTKEESKSTNNRRLVLRNFENLKIILEANSDEETSHPVQIEQWLAEIISESDLEPVANIDFLEHSKIDSN